MKLCTKKLSKDKINMAFKILRSIYMGKEEVEFMPSGLVTCFLNDSEVRIMKISPERITLRVSEKLEEIKKIKVVFYIFN